MAFVAERRRFGDLGKGYRGGYSTHPGPKMTGNKRGSNWFCDSYKMSGSGIEKCFKLHGYPPNWGNNKDKRFAYLARVEDHNDDVKEDNVVHIMLVLVHLVQFSKWSSS